MNTLEAATALHQAGISVVPVMADGSKRPAGNWKHYQKSRATLQEIGQWFAPGSTAGLGVVTGSISGNLEMTEIEGRAKDRLQELATLATDSGIAQLWNKLNRGWLEQSPSGGLHWFYRTEEPTAGNTRIARDQSRMVLAETRGEGGFVVTAPSGGTVHPSGAAWTRLLGGPATMPTLTTEERADFHTLLGTLGAPEPEPQPELFTPQQQRDPLAGITPGDDYEQKTSWTDILRPAGWQLVTQRGNTCYWRRPGKTDGFSATTGHADDRDRLYVFTSSTEFPQEIPITKFGAYTTLHHAGNYSEAAGALQKLGYGAVEHIAVPPLRKFDAPTVTAPVDKQEEAINTPTPIPAPATEGNLALATVTDIATHRQPEADILTVAETDDGNAMRLVATHGQELRYNPDRNRWLAWDGQRWRWQPAGGGYARELAKELARTLPEQDSAKLKHKRISLSATGISNTLAQAQTDQRITVSTEELDAHAWELNTPGGIIDLRTGTLHPADPAKLHTRMTTVTPNFDADDSMWADFLADTFPGAPELTSYMQRLVGYSAVGEVAAHVLPFAYGSGGNGKGVFLEAIAGVLGDYATSSPSGFLMASSYQQHSTEIARLAGARFVICSEVNETDRFDEAKVKLLTGGDRLTARFMRQDDFTFKPTHHLWLMGNFQPAVESGGDGFWRRLRLIPFTHTVPDDKIIEGLQEKLATDHGPAILAWIARGAAAYAQGGLQEPDSVRAATTQYAADVDTVGRFLEDDCITGPAARMMTVRVQELRTAYDKWCMENGETPVKGRAFTQQLSRHAVLTGRNAPKSTGGIRMYGGIGMRAHSDWWAKKDDD